MRFLLLLFVALGAHGAVVFPFGFMATNAPGTNGGGGAFSPDSLTSMVAWWKADAIEGLSGGDPVSSWTDSHDGTYTLTRPSGDRPTYIASDQNSKPSVAFNGTTLTNTLFALTNKPATYFMVFAPSNITANFSLIEPDASGSARIGIHAGQMRFDKHNNAVIGTQTGTLSSNAWVIMALTYSDAGAWAMFTSGSADGSGTSDQTFTASYAYLGGLGGYAYYGRISEMAIFGAVLSEADRNSVGDYLATKYGLTWSH